ncbi:MAG: citrate synthase [Ruminococcaceae bacterium]|nr:citrate synthase [Oscillospiraceae bacterium]
MQKLINEITHDEFSANELKDIIATARDHYSIPPASFQTTNVKRGLRNIDGTGVVAGITKIALVHGYLLNEGEVEPIEGKLYYRGHSVEDLVDAYVRENRFGYEECSYILFFGELPTKEQLKVFNTILNENRQLPAHFSEDVIMRVPTQNIMNKISSSILSLYAYDENPDDCSFENVMRQSIQIMAQMPVIAAQAYSVARHAFLNESLTLHYPLPGLSTAENFLRIVRPDSSFTDEEAKLLDLCLVLHAEHGGGNNSAFTCRVLSSAGTDTYSAISGAVNSLKGSLHGGANIKVEKMFDDIKANVSNWADEEEVYNYLIKILKGEAGDKSGKIYGMGHAIYTYSDPRAVTLKKYASKLAIERGFEDEFHLIELVEKLTPQAFMEFKGNSTKNICANVDLYSGMVYRMLGIPAELYTPLFAIARVAGWCAHRMEEITTGGRIIRPAYKSISKAKNYIALEDRE